MIDDTDMTGQRVLVVGGSRGIGNGIAAAAAQEGALTIGVTGDAGGNAAKVNIASVGVGVFIERRMVSTSPAASTGP